MPRLARIAVEPDMNVTPLVDVVLVLLIIFMVVAPQLDQEVQVELPGVFNADPEVEGNRDPVKVSVAKPNEFHIDERQFDLDGAVKYLVEQQAIDPTRRLLLRADSKLRYGEIRAFMSRIQQAGFPGMNFMVGEKHQEGAVRATAAYGDQQQAPDAAAGGGQPDAIAPPANPGAPFDASSPLEASGS